MSSRPEFSIAVGDIVLLPRAAGGYFHAVVVDVDAKNVAFEPCDPAIGARKIARTEIAGAWARRPPRRRGRRAAPSDYGVQLTMSL